MQDFLQFLGILQDTRGIYNIGPWTSLNLDAIDTFMDYYTVIYSPSSFNYTVTYSYDASKIAAIFEHGMELFCE